MHVGLITSFYFRDLLVVVDLGTVNMVRIQKKTATPANKAPPQEKREIFALIRTLQSNKPLSVLRNCLVSNKKIEKLEPGDEVSVRQGANRGRGVILAIGKIDNFHTKENASVLYRFRKRM